MTRLLALAVLLSPLVVQAKPVVCKDAETGKTTKVQPARVQNGAKGLQRILTNKGVHVLDLPDEARAHRRKLDVDLKKEDWCAVHAHLEALRKAVSAVRVDGAFIDAKARRVEEWVKSSKDPAAAGEAQRLLQAAAADVSAGRAVKANRQLNRVLATVLGSADPWLLPAPRKADDEERAPPASARTAAGLPDYEVEAGCPVLAKRGAATSTELADVLERLRGAMNDKKVRLTDLHAGPDLGAELDKHLRGGETWPAARIACVLLARTDRARSDLGLVMARFQRVNEVRDERGVPEPAKGRFSELVRRASDQLAASDFQAAHATLEELLVLLGEPARAGDTLPRGG